MSDPTTPKGCCSPARVDAPPQSIATVANNGHAPEDVVEIPGGTAMVGTDRPAIAVDGEGPLRRKRVKPFKMDAGCVTNTRFQSFVAATGYVTDAERIGDSTMRSLSAIRFKTDLAVAWPMTFLNCI